MKTNQTLLQFMLRAQQIASQDAAMSNKGYAMLMTSTVAIMMFSLIGAYLTMTNMSKSATAAYADSSNTFYAAESGLNDRAAKILARFNDNNVPTGMSPGQTSNSGIPSAADMRNCITPGATSMGTADFMCMSYDYEHNTGEIAVQRNDLSKDKVGNDLGGSMNVVSRDKTNNYIAYTFVADTSDYTRDPSGAIVAGAIPTITIPPQEAFGGLKAMEYKYTVYSTAAKVDPTNPAEPTIGGGAQTVLEMNFRRRYIPLFQFAAFYENDLELDPSLGMTITGPVHTNNNLRAISLGTVPSGATNPAAFTTADIQAGLRLQGRVTVIRNIFDRIDSTTVTGAAQRWRPNGPTGCAPDSTATTQDRNCGSLGVYRLAAPNNADNNPANYIQFPDFASNLSTRPAAPASAADIAPLTDTEIRAFGDRMETTATNPQVQRLNPPPPGFLREVNYKLKQEGKLKEQVGEYYAKADMRLKMFPGRLPALAAATYEQFIPFNFSSFESGSPRATINKGQLRSLMQPVLQLGTTPVVAGSTQEQVIRALQISIASSRTTVKLATDINAPVNSAPLNNNDWRQTFNGLLPGIPGVNALLGANPLALTPNAIATICSPGSQFLPAPIQVIDRQNPLPPGLLLAPAGPNTNARANALTNARNNSLANFGFFDNIKNRQMTMLQTNIRSLTVWNGNGVFVNATDENLNGPYTAAALPALTAPLPSTRDLAFARAPQDLTQPAGSFPALGLAAQDRTDGGLVFHATVSDDLDGDGTNDITTSAANPIPGRDSKGDPIPSVDYFRTYPGGPGVGGIQQSPYGFAFSGGTELPGPFTIATDQAAYIQGDFNNLGVTPAQADANAAAQATFARRQPAAIMADTVTVLSNNCVNRNQNLSCGFPAPVVNSELFLSKVPTGNPTTIVAALISNIQTSTPAAYNGGLNRFMRTLENWSINKDFSANLNYVGSFVSLGIPLEVTEQQLSLARPPIRDFRFDQNFNDFTKLPPLTPKVSYLRQDVFKRSYN